MPDARTKPIFERPTRHPYVQSSTEDENGSHLGSVQDSLLDLGMLRTLRTLAMAASKLIVITFRCSFMGSF
jgi:hypothetical protein